MMKAIYAFKANGTEWRLISNTQYDPRRLGQREDAITLTEASIRDMDPKELVVLDAELLPVSTKTIPIIKA